MRSLTCPHLSGQLTPAERSSPQQREARASWLCSRPPRVPGPCHPHRGSCEARWQREPLLFMSKYKQPFVHLFNN